MNDTKITNTNEAQELDSASLDLVVGGVVVHQATGGELDARKQEQSEKLREEQLQKQ